MCSFWCEMVLGIDGAVSWFFLGGGGLGLLMFRALCILATVLLGVY